MKKLIGKKIVFKKPKISFKRRYTAKKEYLDNFLLLFCLGTTWTVSTIVGMNYPNVGMLLFFLGVTLFKPFINITRKAFKQPVIHEDSPLRMVNICMVIGVPAGLVFGFFSFSQNINNFYPTFSVLMGIIFGIVGYVFHLRMYGIISMIISVGAVYIGYSYPENFETGGFFTGCTFIIFAFISRVLAIKDKTSPVKGFETKPKEINSEMNRPPISNKKIPSTGFAEGIVNKKI